MSKAKLYNYIKFLAFVLCFAGIPLAMTITGYYHTWVQNRNIFEKNISREISAFYTRLELLAEQQKFWYFLFDNRIVKKTRRGKDTSESITILANELNSLKKDYDFDYVVYHPQLGAIPCIASDTLGGNFEDWKIAFNSVWRFKKPGPDIVLTDKEEVILGKVFGPQFYIDHLNLNEFDNKDLQLCWTDSQYKRRIIWNAFIYDCLVMVFIKPESLYDISCVKKYLETIRGELPFNFGFSIKDSSKNIFYHDNLNNDRIKEIESASLVCEKEHLLEKKSDNYYIFPKFLRPGVTVYGYFDKSEIVNIKPSVYWNFAVLICFILSIVLTLYGRNIIILRKVDKVSIRWKLGFLFFFANGLPLLVLIFIGNDYLKQARADHIQKIISEGTAFLQDFDEKYELEFARSIIRKERIKSDIVMNKKNSFMDEKDLDRLYYGISSDSWVMFLIASQGQTLLRTDDGVFDDSYLEKSINPNVKDRGNKNKKLFDKEMKSQMEFSQKLGYYLLNRFNNKPIDSKTATEIELVLEAAMRRKLDSFLYEFIGRMGTYMIMGLGQNVHPAMIDAFCLNDNNLFDYFMLVTIRTKKFQRNYLNRALTQANRNELKLKVISWNNENLFIPLQEYSFELDEFRKRLSPFPIKEPIILKHKNEDYVAMGFDCKHLERAKLIGLYPLDLIEEHVILRRNELIMFSLLSLVVTLILSSIIIKSFISPLSAIYDGAKAIERKDFQYQLPSLGRDEFGAMGRIFNEVIVDLEELSVAGAIQEQLLPNSEIRTGYFSLYGKSVAMGALGGDYFDFIEMEDNKFSVALGDVAGHGVGASLIMAMAKAGLVSLDSLWKTPQKLINKLHDMVYKSKTQNQRKIMTFQYIYLDGESGHGVYSNAGGCSPFIIRKSKGTVEELKLSGAVLGAFKKGKFTETEVDFEDGDAIVFYTDGVVECKNKSGVVLGYDNLKDLLQKCWDKDAKKFYNNVYNSYLEYIGGNKDDAEDDVTVVILVFNKPVEVYNHSEN
ncbi:MAG: SpoIIE family protein phosphatase [Candidatus Riflebacteria bacterium]|nr:SpoIIE family protein phosphatase [Candidatus Riflebacteria bacterium]